ncbi:MAG: DUF5028 domain-containing protein [Clostridiales bacterium]|nr:DUF5028 domain-containing protein [Clostridiales bacterium]
MKKIIISILCSAAIILCVIRIYFVNSQGVLQPICTYSRNEEVSFENDFFNSIQDTSDGYTITAHETELLSLDKFKEKYGIEKDIGIDNCDYVYTVEVTIRNKTNSNGIQSGINMQQFIIQNGSFITFFSPEAYPYINQNPESRFSLAENDSLDFIIPFALYKENVDINDFEHGKPALVISLYPRKKIIEL